MLFFNLETYKSCVSLLRQRTFISKIPINTIVKKLFIMPCTGILLILKVDWSYVIKIVVIKNLSPFILHNSPLKHLKF